jgi:long-chain fatty acid transport protein
MNNKIKESVTMKRFVMRHLISTLAVSGLLGVSSQAFASAFQLWEQDGASVGNYHAGYAALANDASTSWYNPAGITRFKNQQIVVGGVGIMSDFKYQGSVSVTEIVPKGTGKPPFIVVSPSTVTFPSVTAQGGVFSFVPNLHYVTPLTERLGFGFSIDVPFGLKTDYGRSTPLRYAASLTSITVVNISPALGFKVTDKGSLGAGFDIQKAWAEFDNVGVLLAGVPSILSAVPPPVTVAVVPAFSGTSTNKANGTGYGFHLGGLYEFTPDTRVGLSYHSQVVHHLSGNSTLSGTAANFLNGGTGATGGNLHAGHSTAKITLPPYTALSAYHRLMPQVGLMGSVIYTQWSTFKTLTLSGVAGGVSKTTSPYVAKSTSITVSIPENYRNTWNLSVGADYYPTDRITLRGALGYDETPIQNNTRNIQLPDNNRYVVALGGHYQASKAVGLDLGWTHLFFKQANINPPAQVTGGQTVVTSGHVTGGADVIGGQVTWDIA